MAASDRVREDTTGKLHLHVPLRGALGLPGPVEPAVALLISIQLALDELTNVGTFIGGKSIDVADSLAITATECSAALVSAIVTGTNSLSVEILGTIGHGSSPLSDNCPLVSVEDVIIDEAAGIADVGSSVHGKQTVVEDFVVVSVHHDVVNTGGLAHEPVPGLGRNEAIVKDHCGLLARLACDTPGIIVVLLESILVYTARDAGLVQSFDGSDDICIATVSCSKRLKGGLGVLNGVTLLPGNGTALSTVVEAILRSRSYVI